MLIVAFTYISWIFFSPLNVLLGASIGILPPLPILIINTIVYIPFIYKLIKYWLRIMMKRVSGPAAGIDTVDSGRAKPEPGDEWGTATRRYESKPESKLYGSKSDIRDPLTIDSGFFVKLPDLDSGEELFDLDELRVRAMVKSRVSSGGWIDRSTSSRSLGSMVSTDSTHGRPFRSRQPTGEASSIDVHATVMAAVARSGKFVPGSRIQIKPSDIREKVFAGKTPLTIILIIDVSLSMKGYMKEVRKIIGRIEHETRGTKDRVGIIAFKDSGAIEVQTPTTNWNKLYRGLARLRISGLTPLAEGIMKAIETVRRERMRNKNIEPLLIMVSDFAPNIPLAQSVGPGHAQFTPVRDLVKAARLVKKNGIRLVTINVNTGQIHWVKLLKRPYHDALELATFLRMKKDGFSSVVETILSVPKFRESFSSYLIASIAGGRTYLANEVMKMNSVLSEFIASTQAVRKIDPATLKAAEEYLAR